MLRSRVNFGVFLILTSLPCWSGVGQDQANQVAAEVPDIDSVIDRYLDKVGGLDHLQMIRSVKVARRDIWTDGAREEEMRTLSSYSGLKYHALHPGRFHGGYDGTFHWRCDIVCAGRRLTGSAIRRPFSFHFDDPVGWPLQVHRLRSRMQAVENSTAKDSGIRISIAVPDDQYANENHHWPKVLVFDEKSGLLTRVEWDIHSCDYSDYRTVDGIAVPFEMVKENFIGFRLFSSTRRETIELIEFNVDLDEEEFEVPEELNDHKYER